MTPDTTPSPVMRGYAMAIDTLRRGYPIKQWLMHNGKLVCLDSADSTRRYILEPYHSQPHLTGDSNNGGEAGQG